jgi:hypothetical protein
LDDWTGRPRTRHSLKSCARKSTPDFPLFRRWGPEITLATGVIVPRIVTGNRARRAQAEGAPPDSAGLPVPLGLRVRRARAAQNALRAIYSVDEDSCRCYGKIVLIVPVPEGVVTIRRQNTRSVLLSAAQCPLLPGTPAYACADSDATGPIGHPVALALTGPE